MSNFYPQPKLITFRCQALLDFMRSKPCCVCGAPPPSHAHHESFGLKAFKGMSKKVHDTMTVPLCHNCHTEQHAKPAWNTFLLIKSMEYVAEFLSQCEIRRKK